MITEVNNTANQICCNTFSYTDFVSILISFFALIASIINFINYKKLQTQNNDLQEKYNEMVDIQTLTAQGALETQVRTAINEAYKQVIDIAAKLQAEPENKMLQSIYISMEELYRNAYEDACAKYIDNKIDKERFRRMYLSEIRRLVEEEPHKEAYSTNQTAYDCTLKVYNEWHHPERTH